MRKADDTIVDLSALVLSNTSEVVDLGSIVNFSVQIVWTSTTAAFTVAVQVSNDGVNYVTLGSPQAVANDNGNVMVVQQNNPYKHMRVLITRTSGTLTTLVCTYEGKGF